MTIHSSPSDPPGDHWWDPVADSAEDWLSWANALPFCRDLGITCMSLDRGAALFVMNRSVLTPNPNGSVNGGLLAAAADQTIGALTRRAIGRDRLPATASLHIQFHSPAIAPLTLRARLLGGGRRVLFAEVAIEDRDGEIAATAQATMISRSGTKAATNDCPAN